MEDYNLGGGKDFDPLNNEILGYPTRYQPWAPEILAEERGNMECVGKECSLLTTALRPNRQTGYWAVLHIFRVCVCTNFFSLLPLIVYIFL